MDAIRKQARYTYAAYATWDDDKRYELIEGQPYAMSPGPSTRHQGISMSLSGMLFDFLKDKPCKVFAAPFDVRLHGEGDEDDTVVQPDIVVICDKSKLDEKGCNGAPDMVVEIVSPSSFRHDTHTKFRLYQAAGVREYWIVNPDAKTLQTHLLKDGEYVTKTYADNDHAPVVVLEGCTVNLGELFGEDAL